MPDRPLTPIQRRILEYIRDRIRKRSPPTIREIGERFGFRSTGTVRDHLHALEKKGYLSLNRGMARGIELAEELREEGVPILGRVAAGVPLLSEENLEGVLSVEGLLPLQKADHFALRVQGDSMQGAGIFAEDYVIVRACRTATPGDIVVALVDEEATVKRFQLKRESPFLQPENPAYDPIPVTPETRILGKVVGLMRSMG